MDEFREGDVVELRARGVVRVVNGSTLFIKFHDLPNVLGVPSKLVTNLSIPRVMTEEEARGLMDDEL